jgi:hypothetical protein
MTIVQLEGLGKLKKKSKEKKILNRLRQWETGLKCNAPTSEPFRTPMLDLRFSQRWL